MRKRRPNFKRFSIIGVSCCTDPIGALAHLQLARVFAFRETSTKSAAAYKDFLGTLERRRPRCPGPQERQSRVRQGCSGGAVTFRCGFLILFSGMPARIRP